MMDKTIKTKMSYLISSLEKAFPLTGNIREISLALKKDKSTSTEESLQLEEIQSLSEEIYKSSKSNVELLKSQIKALDELEKKVKNKK